MVDGNARKRPNGVQAFVSDREFRRNPRGTKNGGKFAAGRVASEPVIELVEGDTVGLESDGSKAFEERQRRADDAMTDQVVESSVEPESVAEVIPTIVEVDPIALGGKKEFDSGSWQYPPPSSSVDELAHFFATVEISDSAVANIENADKDRDFFAAEEEYNAWQRTQPSPTTRYRRKHPVEYAAYTVESQKRRAVLNAVQFHQGFIPRNRLLDTARLGGLILSCDDLDQDARVKARRMKFKTSAGEIVEAGDVFRDYRLRDISEAFFNRRRYSRPD